MSGNENDEPDYSDYCKAVRIGREGKHDVEVVIFYTPLRGFHVHNGYLVEKRELRNYGRPYHQLKIVTPRGKIIFVRRYEDQGEFKVTSDGYWLKQKQAIL